MKSLLQCVEGTKSGSVQPYLFVGDYYDGHTVEATCPLGHAAFSIVQNPKFETLLTAAADALIHDQTLQAVACLAASRERLFELAIRVFARSAVLIRATSRLRGRRWPRSLSGSSVLSCFSILLRPESPTSSTRNWLLPGTRRSTKARFQRQAKHSITQARSTKRSRTWRTTCGLITKSRCVPCSTKRTCVKPAELPRVFQ